MSPGLQLRRAGAVVFVGVTLLLLVGGQLLGVPMGLAFVETGSMAPTLDSGDGFVGLPPALLGGVSEGDVVTFESRTIEGGRLTTHRVVDETPEGYVTRGDANAFTDQQAGEPPVPRDRIVAEALQVGGHVVVIPNLGEYVAALRGLFAALGSRFGLGVNQVVAFVLAASIAAYLLDERGAAGGKRAERSTGRRDGVSGLLVVGGAVALVVATATVSMTVASGAVALPYDSVNPGDPGQGGIPAGTTENGSVELRNGGLVPMTAVLSTESPNAGLARERVSLGPRTSRTVNVSITAPAEPGNYEVTVARHQYLGVLPAGLLAGLAAAHPWLGVVAVDLLLAVVVGGFGLAVLGRGRVRFRSRRPVPPDVSVRRRLRSLYRRD
jgi:signal peptidase